MFKATAVITSSTDNTLVSGQPVPFRLQYRKDDMAPPTEVFEVTDPNLPVYYRKYICEELTRLWRKEKSLVMNAFVYNH